MLFIGVLKYVAIPDIPIHYFHAPNLPPSTERLCPVMYPDSSDAKNATVFAISSGVPNRASEVF